MAEPSPSSVPPKHRRILRHSCSAVVDDQWPGRVLSDPDRRESYESLLEGASRDEESAKAAAPPRWNATGIPGPQPSLTPMQGS